jgi:hypothetical protein
VPGNTFETPNPYALGSILAACRNRTIVASRDIVDLQGLKLWARDNPVSDSLRQRLLQRKLSAPLETCLRAVDGVTNATLIEDWRAFLGSGHALAGVVEPCRASIERELPQLPLHPVVQILLTAARDANPSMYQHAVAGMALAGALAAATAPTSTYNLRLALLGGLLHDLGEMYIHPQYLEPSREVDLYGFRQLSAHPRIGSLLIGELTDYPRSLALAIDEHHERLDGSGYPAGRSNDKLSALGHGQRRARSRPADHRPHGRQSEANRAHHSAAPAAAAQGVERRRPVVDPGRRTIGRARAAAARDGFSAARAAARPDAARRRHDAVRRGARRAADGCAGPALLKSEAEVGQQRVDLGLVGHDIGAGRGIDHRPGQRRALGAA